MFGGDGEVVACCKEIRLPLGGGAGLKASLSWEQFCLFRGRLKTILHIQRQKGSA